MQTPPQALSDIRVLDFTHSIAGPYCTKMLADYGADVLKVERPDGGDMTRRSGPFPDDEPHPEKSGLFLHLNTNKRGITLNLKSATGRQIVQQLIREVDVVVESFRPGVMARLGLDYGSIRATNPGVVMTSISNFGQNGPYRDYKGSEIAFYGMGGEMYTTGVAEREPVKMGGDVVQFQAGATAAVATMGAVFAARLQNIGQQVDVSIMETQVGSIDRRMPLLLAYQYTGEISQRQSVNASGGYPGGFYPCKDGYVEITGGRTYFPRIVKMLGEPEFLKDPKWYQHDAQRNEDLKAEFEEFFYPWILDRTKQEVWLAAQEARVLSGPLNTIEDLQNDSTFIDRGAFAEIEHPQAGTLRYPGRPFIMEKTPWSIRRPAPLLGQHNREILTGFGYTDDEIVSLRQQGVI
ncbi:MAG: CoA transferase [Chloroflexi bacterium]|nr:CoA transferase [Chloroflexota bacterium]